MEIGINEPGLPANMGNGPEILGNGPELPAANCEATQPPRIRYSIGTIVSSVRTC